MISNYDMKDALTTEQREVLLGCLASWQARLVRRHIEANLEQPLDNDTLANVVKLSPSHFCRVFKRTFGVTAHQYVMQRRVNRAQQLMLTSSEALSSIAISCGMCDQAHLTRWFRRVTGIPPAAWRRANESRAVISAEAFAPGAGDRENRLAFYLKRVNVECRGR